MSQLYGGQIFCLRKLVCQPSSRHQQSAEYGFRNGVLNFIQVQQRGTGVSTHTQPYKTVTRLGSDHDISISCHVDTNIFLDYSEHTKPIDLSGMG